MHAWLDLSQNYRNTLHLHTVDQIARTVDTVMPDHLLSANANAGSYQMEEYENSGLVVILHCLNSFLHSNYVVFSLFICTAQRKPQDKCRFFSPISYNGCNFACEVLRRLLTGEYLVLLMMVLADFQFSGVC